MSGRPAEPPSPVSFREALRWWLRLGCISFGGPAGQIAIMHQELVERRRWISERRFLHALNYCMVLPGPEAQQLATYIGWLMHGARGGIAAGALFVLPSLFLLIALSWIYMAFGTQPLVAGVLYGIKPAVTAIVLAAAWRIGSRTLKSPPLWAIAAAAFIAIFAFSLPFPAIVLAAGVLGYLGGQVAPQQFVTGGGHGVAKTDYGPALIGDDTPPPPHARASRGRLLRIAGIGIGLWAAATGLLIAAVRLARTADADGLVLHQGRAADLRRRLCGAALRLSGGGGKAPVAERDADDRRAGPRRNHAGAADHGGGLRRLRRRVDRHGAAGRAAHCCRGLASC